MFSETTKPNCFNDERYFFSPKQTKKSETKQKETGEFPSVCPAFNFFFWWWNNNRWERDLWLKVDSQRIAHFTRGQPSWQAIIRQLCRTGLSYFLLGHTHTHTDRLIHQGGGNRTEKRRRRRSGKDGKVWEVETTEQLPLQLAYLCRFDWNKRPSDSK